MTAEIGILNRAGVALAADSAVTVGMSGAQKVYNSANKLFSLSKFHPVGIMIYGGANFMGVPWETIIKTYRKKINTVKFDSLKEYCEDFVHFIKTDKRLISESSERSRVVNVFGELFLEILNNVSDHINEHMIKHGSKPSSELVEDWINGYTIHHTYNLDEAEFVDEFDENFIDEFTIKHSEVIKAVVSRQMEFELSKNTLDKLIKLAALICSKSIFTNSSSGLIFAGYGEEELFPSLYEYKIEGIFCGKMKIKEGDSSIISAEYENDGKTTGEILAFAQKEMVDSYLTGVEPNLYRGILDILSQTFTEYPEIIEGQIHTKLTSDDKEIMKDIGIEFVKRFNSAINDMQRKKYIAPILDIVDILPKEDLAAMAEALVNLTSFKRKISIDTETVGGPIDVAVITKGDGLVWIKRKHYFKPELNYHFFKNYLRGDENVGNDE